MEVGELSVRKNDGGDVDVLVRHVAGASPAGRREIVVLVHGYANSQSDASQSYDACLSRMENLPAAMRAPVTAAFFKFYWPGDLAVHVLSPASYPWKIKPAIEAGRRLADYLAGLSGPNGTAVEVHLVSHSLGGRVVLELLSRLAMVPSSIVVRTLSVMACAVPVIRVADPRDLRPAALVARRSQALHSSDDVVLQCAFPSGETLGGDGVFPEAVGRFGGPDGTWSRRPKMTGYGHSDYWSSIYPAQLLAEFLGAPVTPSVAPAAIPPRALPPTHTLSRAGIPKRSLPTRRM